MNHLPRTLKSSGASGLLRGLVFASLLGLSGAATFWLVAIRPQKAGLDGSAG